MIIQCEECTTRFRLADEKLKPTGTKVRCSKCKHVFTVMPPEPEITEKTPAPAPVEETPAPEPAEETPAQETAAEPPAPDLSKETPPPEPEEEPPAPETTDESIDFDAMNMEAVPADPSAELPTPEEETFTPEEDSTDDSLTMEFETSEEETDLDFSGLEQEMAATTPPAGDLADEFSFAAPAASAEGEEDVAADSTDEFELGDIGEPAAAGPNERAFDDGTDTLDDSEDEPAFDESIESSEQPSGEFALDEPTDTPGEFDFDESEEASEETPGEFTFDEPADTPGEFDFDESEEAPEDAPGEFALDEPADSPGEFDFDEPELDTPPLQDDAAEAASSEFELGDGDDAFSFDETPGFDDDLSNEVEPESSEWGDDSSSEGDTFDFDEPAFETEDSTPGFGGEESGGDDLQFGEIDLMKDEGETSGLGSGGDFAGATLETEEPTLDVPPPAPQARKTAYDDHDDEPLAAPPVKRKKGPLTSILLLLVLLLIALGGAAGYFYMQDGSLDINRIIERFTGQTQQAVQEHKIGITITDTSYVNNRTAGQLLVVQGSAVNNFPSARSAITIKGVLLDAQGGTLFQQTVYCGNPLDADTLQRETFETLELAMNNQFGDSLSNMNVAAGAAIPFTIVFRNLPDDIANINVEVVTSKPGS